MASHHYVCMYIYTQFIYTNTIHTHTFSPTHTHIHTHTCMYDIYMASDVHDPIGIQAQVQKQVYFVSK